MDARPVPCFVDLVANLYGLGKENVGYEQPEQGIVGTALGSSRNLDAWCWMRHWSLVMMSGKPGGVESCMEAAKLCSLMPELALRLRCIAQSCSCQLLGSGYC